MAKAPPVVPDTSYPNSTSSIASMGSPFQSSNASHRLDCSHVEKGIIKESGSLVPRKKHVIHGYLVDGNIDAGSFDQV